MSEMVRIVADLVQIFMQNWCKRIADECFEGICRNKMSSRSCSLIFLTFTFTPLTWWFLQLPHNILLIAIFTGKYKKLYFQHFISRQSHNKMHSHAFKDTGFHSSSHTPYIVVHCILIYIIPPLSIGYTDNDPAVTERRPRGHLTAT